MTDTHPRLLTRELLGHLDDRLKALDAPIAKLWRPGLQPHQMDVLTAELGITLPEEARIWWGWHDGADQDATPPQRALGSGWEPLSLSEAVQDAIRKRQYAAEQEPNAAWPDSWIAVCGDVSYPRLACDCAASPEAPAPIHFFDPLQNPTPAVPRLGSLGELVHVWLEALDDGTWHIDPANGEFAVLDPTALLNAKGADIADLL